MSGSQYESDSAETSQHEQPRGSRNGQDQRGWITKAEWTVLIKENAASKRRSPSVVTIFEVPKTLMKESKGGEAYVPARVAIGPYHHAELRLMDNQKGKALGRVMARRDGSDPNKMDFSDRAKKDLLEDLLEEILLLEKEIRENYEEEIECDGETLALMLSLDGCFILEILRTLFGDKSPGASRYYEPLFHKRKINYTGIDILNDILKLENQIPLIVLRKLLQWEFKSYDVNEKLFDLLYKPFLGFFYPFDCRKNICSWPKPDVQKVHHLLGLLHACIVSPSFNNSEYVDSSVNGEEEEQDNAASGDIQSIPHAVQLIKSGIKFQRCDDGSGIEDIFFDRKSTTIFLPTIIIRDSTEIVFRNVIAFEMCMKFQMNPVAVYLTLMGMLIGSEEDVALLTKERIIINWLGSDKGVVELFHGLRKGIAADTNYTSKLIPEVNRYYKKKWSVWFADFKHRYFSSPWNMAGLCAATTLLLLTIVQTVYVILTYDVTLSSNYFITKNVREPLFQIFH